MEASPKFKIVVYFLLLAVCIVELSNGQAICNVPLNGLLTCRPAVTAPNPQQPSATCCASLTNADLKCLCQYKNSKVLPSLGIDPNLAMQLPQKCKLSSSANC